MDLVTHPFDPGQHAVEDMFNWIGPNAGSPGHEGDLAALAANGYAHRLAENATLLGQTPTAAESGTRHLAVSIPN